MHANSTDISFDLELFGNPSGGSGYRYTHPQALSPIWVMKQRLHCAGEPILPVIPKWKWELFSALILLPSLIRLLLLNMKCASPVLLPIQNASTALVPAQVLQAGSDNFFTTAPPAATTRKMRFAAFGDCGRNDNGFQAGSLSSYLHFCRGEYRWNHAAPRW